MSANLILSGNEMSALIVELRTENTQLRQQIAQLKLALDSRDQDLERLKRTPSWKTSPGAGNLTPEDREAILTQATQYLGPIISGE